MVLIKDTKKQSEIFIKAQLILGTISNKHNLKNISVLYVLYNILTIRERMTSYKRTNFLFSSSNVVLVALILT